jgi:7-carboxy-7-deazaguanine synthase
MKKGPIQIQINEMFHSLSGEVSGVPVGTPTNFIRFQGCNLNCEYCDTKASQEITASNPTPNTALPGFTKTDDDVMSFITHNFNNIGTQHTIITGGEPLLWWPAVNSIVDGILNTNLVDSTDVHNSEWWNQTISIETNGSLFDCDKIIHHERLFYVVDIKMDMLEDTEYRRNILLWLVASGNHSNIIFKMPVAGVTENIMDSICVFESIVKEFTKTSLLIRCCQDNTIYLSPVFHIVQPLSGFGMKDGLSINWERILSENSRRFFNYALSLQYHKILNFK